MKKPLLIFLIAINATLTTAQWDEFYYFEPYYNKTVYATQQIKTCRIYEERLSDSIPAKIIVGEQRFDGKGKLGYDRVYYTADTLKGRLLTYAYDSLGRVTDTWWTWIELQETDWYTYIYNTKGHLIKRVMYKKKESDTKYKKVEIQQLCYDKIGIWLTTKTKPGGNKTYYQFREDTTFVKNTKTDDAYAYVKGKKVGWSFAGLILRYEYDSLGQMVKFTKSSLYGKPFETKEYTYENGLLVSSFEVFERYDGTVRKRRTYVYEY